MSSTQCYVYYCKSTSARPIGLIHLAVDGLYECINDDLSSQMEEALVQTDEQGRGRKPIIDSPKDHF